MEAPWNDEEHWSGRETWIDIDIGGKLIEKQTDRRTDEQIDRQTDRQTDRSIRNHARRRDERIKYKTQTDKVYRPTRRHDICSGTEQSLPYNMRICQLY